MNVVKKKKKIYFLNLVSIIEMENLFILIYLLFTEKVEIKYNHSQIIYILVKISIH